MTPVTRSRPGDERPAFPAPEAENAKIKLLRESLDLVRTARATLPNGVSDIPA